MISEYKDTMLSKSMISVIPKMIYKTNDIILNYFDKAIFKPPLLENVINSLWPADYDEFVFCSSTSIISDKQLKMELIDAGLLDKKFRSKRGEIEGI